MQLIGDGKKQIKGKIAQEVLEEIMGREVSDKELASILEKVFDIQNPGDAITK